LTKELWAFPTLLRSFLIAETEKDEKLFIAQNLSLGEKEVLMRQKKHHFKNELIIPVK